MLNFIDWLLEKENSDDLPFEMSKDEIIIWVKQIHENLLSNGKKPWEGKHYGDCTKENVSCQICMYQTWLDDYEEYCRNYKKN
jgi:hypothetical protein